MRRVPGTYKTIPIGLVTGIVIKSFRMALYPIYTVFALLNK